jgi:hypothetical protein
MPVVNCTPRIADVRAVRAAAFFPFVTGLALLIVATPLSWWIDHDAWKAAAFLGGSIALLFTAALIKRGVFLAAVAVAAALVAIWITMLATIGHEARRTDVLEIVLTLVGTAGLCWLSVRGVTASWRLRSVPWQSRSAATIWTTIAQLPRDHRLSASVEPFVSAAGVYTLGLCVALVVFVATGIGLLAGLAFLPFALAGSRLMQRARQTLALRVPEVRARDPRPPVLLVRSFADDLLELEPRFEYFSRLFRTRVTLEEFVVGRVMSLGPVVAIGKPNEALSPLGAAREYVFGPGWQARVSSLLDECSWAIAILGGTEGLRWEYEQILQRNLTGRFIVVVPPATPDVFQERWDIFQEAFPPAGEADLSPASQMGGPLCAVFPEGTAPVLFCSKYRNETAYSVVFAMLFATLATTPSAGRQRGGVTA